MDARFPPPDPEGLLTSAPVCARGHQMTARTEVAVDEAVRRQEPLRLLRRLEPLHLPLALPRRSVRVLRAAVQMAARSVPNPGQEVAPRDAVAPRAVGDEAPRLEPQPSQQPLEEALDRKSVV